MGNLTLAYRTRSYSTGTLGRALCNARTHHFVADDAGGEAIGAGELFFSGISACAVNMVERLANAGQIPLQWMDVHVEAYRDAEKPPGISPCMMPSVSTSRCGGLPTRMQKNW